MIDDTTSTEDLFKNQSSPRSSIENNRLSEEPVPPVQIEKLVEKRPQEGLIDSGLTMSGLGQTLLNTNIKKVPSKDPDYITRGIVRLFLKPPLEITVVETKKLFEKDLCNYDDECKKATENMRNSKIGSSYSSIKSYPLNTQPRTYSIGEPIEIQGFGIKAANSQIHTQVGSYSSGEKAPIHGVDIRPQYTRADTVNEGRSTYPINAEPVQYGGQNTYYSQNSQGSGAIHTRVVDPRGNIPSTNYYPTQNNFQNDVQYNMRTLNS